ncbi:MAG TPA: DUF4252 domain-containing protein [Blastocatellia bacterium]|nr:DUF4252 domain-containing protein [Blastocatellia bacterium]
MKPFMLFQFITHIAALARQMFLPALILLCAAAVTFGQNNLVQNPQYAKARIDVSHLAALEDKAASVIDVNVDRRTLRLAEKFFKNDKPDEKAIKELIAGIEGITVKIFEFEKEGEYQPADYQMLKTQIDNNPNWIRLAGVRSKKKDMLNVEVSIMTDENDNLLGVAIIAAEKEHLAVINIVGTFDLAKIRDLSGKFNIPDLELEGLGVVKKKTKEKKEEEKKPNQE